MARMSDIRDIFQLVVEGFNDVTSAQHELIGEVHQLRLHIGAQGGDEL